MSRPVSQHRLSVGANGSSVPTRTSMSRTHSHTASASRINRRKSSTFSRAALASLQDAAAAHQSIVGSLPATSELSSSSAVVDGPSLSSFQGMDKKSKMRRASDGTHLLSKKEKAASGELKCEHCGKAYKHGSCLTKHLWEHTPEWQLTSKLLISKHQQVQLLEAASVLVAMNQDGPDSDNSSSPAASGSSDMRDEDLSSTETTPPPQGDNAYRDSSKRFSNNSSVFSRSYQSAFSESVPEHGFSHNRHWSTSSGRPLTAGSNFAESYTGNEDAQDLAAAVGLLSCSYGTPKSAPSALPMDAPPVPPLPAKYQTGYSNFRGQGNDVDMEDEISSDDEAHHPRNDDVDDGMFGKMDA